MVKRKWRFIRGVHSKFNISESRRECIEKGANMIRCCMFDLDGTLLDTVETLAYCGNEILKKYGYDPIEAKQYQYFAGDGYEKQAERALLYAGDKELEHHSAYCVDYMEFFKVNCTKFLKPYDGIVELLKELKARGIKVACFSNKPHQQTIDSLKAVDIFQYFDAVRGQVDGIPVKPDTTGAMLLLDELQGIKPEEVLYLGDTNTDMKTGLTAGFQTVGVTWGFRPKEELAQFEPHFMIDSPEEAIEILKNK